MVAGEEAVISEVWENLPQEWSSGTVHCAIKVHLGWESTVPGGQSPEMDPKLWNRGVLSYVEGFLLLVLCVFLSLDLNVYSLKLFRK